MELLNIIFVFLLFLIAYLSWKTYNPTSYESINIGTPVGDYEEAIKIVQQLGYTKRDAGRIIYDMPSSFTTEEMVQEFFRLTNDNWGV